MKLPILSGDPPGGIDTDERGFVPVDEEGAVVGAAGVWAAGDVTANPVKHGGLATRQADVAAASIAADLGYDVEVPPARPVLHGVLLTGVASAFLRADPEMGGSAGSHVAFNPLWMPPAKIAGRYLAPYLAGERGLVATPVLHERARVDDERALADRDALTDLALTFAKDDAAHQEYRSALHWLQTVEWLHGPLGPEEARLRERWERAVAAR